MIWFASVGVVQMNLNRCEQTPEWAKPMSSIDVQRLKDYVRDELEGKPIVDSVDLMMRNDSSRSGNKREGVFTREFLCPTIKQFFYPHVLQELKITQEHYSPCVRSRQLQLEANLARARHRPICRSSARARIPRDDERYFLGGLPPFGGDDCFCCNCCVCCWCFCCNCCVCC